MFARCLSSFLSLMPRPAQFSKAMGLPETLSPGGVYDMVVRNKIRCYFPRPSERKRIKRHGWWTRMSTLGGRRVIMRRILKGRHVLTH